MQIRPEQPHDIDLIGKLITAAFAAAEHRSGTEAAIVDALRRAGALTLSLVATEGENLVGHVAFSTVLIDGVDRNWFGLAPVAVEPVWQRRGIGQSLIRAGFHRLRELGAQGCVVLGEPAYYKRFGFETDPTLRFAAAPAEYFLRLAFAAQAPSGRVTYHSAFEAG